MHWICIYTFAPVADFIVIGAYRPKFLLPAGSAAALQVLFLLTADFWVFRPAGATCWTDQGEIWLLPTKFHLDRFRGGVYGPQNWKNWNFTNIIAPKRRVSCTIFTKFTWFMCVLSLHNFAKFGCFISINGKIINNLLRWGRFRPNFRRPLAAKLWTGPKKFST